MANENDLIRRGDLKDSLLKRSFFPAIVAAALKEMPKVDAVSMEVHKQVMWERDVAIKQLEKHGIPFCGIAHDVVKIVRCKDCKAYDAESFYCEGMGFTCEADDFCSYGERKDDVK